MGELSHGGNVLWGNCFWWKRHGGNVHGGIVMGEIGGNRLRVVLSVADHLVTWRHPLDGERRSLNGFDIALRDAPSELAVQRCQWQAATARHYF